MSATKTASRPKRGDELSPAELGAWRGFLRVHSALSRELDSELVAEHGLSLSSYEVLLFLAESPDGRMRMAELAESVLLSRSGLTRLADRLERDGLVKREPCPSDLRGALAVITEAGRQRFADARRTHLAGVRDRFLGEFSATELKTLASMWERLQPGAADA